MKLKLKLGRKQIAVLVVLGLIVVALLVNRAGGDENPSQALDTAATQACNDFAAGFSRAHSDSARLTLADKVTTSAAKSDNETVRSRALELGRNADEGNAAWRTSGSALTQACEDSGWTAP
ncbi:hypothetical protein [Actinoplanes solisilvae]|uniref:hypothetical protein n=1 Tax=Actinoplanes solisilvae TaxID=2486853 RepID=UPI000FDC3E48|nr:hypothetical protein [Actinoplanes solisilvae]